MSWNFFNPVNIFVGEGAINRVGEGMSHDDTILLVTTPGSRGRGFVNQLRQYLRTQEVIVFDGVENNPSLDLIIDAKERFAERSITRIVALGGGSAIDTGKALSLCLAENQFCIKDYFSSLSQLPNRALPITAIPTTSGTGSEATPFATVWDNKSCKKLSLQSPLLFPKVAILDPSLTLGTPWATTLSTGLDAIVQAFESIWSRKATSVAVGLSIKSLQLGIFALPRLLANPEELGIRKQMQEASLLAGIAISQTRTALCHSISYPLTAHFGLPHGLACAFTLSEVLRFNCEVDDGRLEQAAFALGLPKLEALQDKVEDLMKKLGFGQIVLKYLRSFEDVKAYQSEMFTRGRSDNNMRAATDEDIHSILLRSWQAIADKVERS